MVVVAGARLLQNGGGEGGYIGSGVADGGVCGGDGTTVMVVVIVGVVAMNCDWLLVVIVVMVALGLMVVMGSSNEVVCALIHLWSVDTILGPLVICGVWILA